MVRLLSSSKRSAAAYTESAMTDAHAAIERAKLRLHYAKAELSDARRQRVLAAEDSYYLRFSFSVVSISFLNRALLPSFVPRVLE